MAKVSMFVVQAEGTTAEIGEVIRTVAQALGYGTLIHGRSKPRRSKRSSRRRNGSRCRRVIRGTGRRSGRPCSSGRSTRN